ncbi:MAG: hypothetical protein CVT80_04940 [Alphaproteobacteria bacterium HGW-Alphaproteobacteria-2]|nr:MAG: hypothetical protein CVT80_04940 [Alphaproteobacteria bacterium HGW-Alphaproteobacteria-2]
MTGITVAPAEGRAAMRAFEALPFEAYRGDPAWHPPLRMVQAQQLDARRNPALAHIAPACFLAWRGGRPVGRIAAFANRAHLAHQQDDTGHFGFLDTLPGAEAAIAPLLSAAEAHLRAQGLAAIAGPFNFSVNEECGLLVEGFETPNMILMPHGRPGYAAALEAAGFAKAMDMHAYIHRMGERFETPPLVARSRARLERNPALTVRQANLRDFETEVALVMDIFNDAWSRNWGFVPLSRAELHHMARELRPILRPGSLWIGMENGHPVTFTLMIPNMNEATRDLDGRLLPFGWAKVLWRLKGHRIGTARLPLAGTRPSHQKSMAGMALAATCFDNCLKDQHDHGVRAVEFSWVLETNRDLITLIDLYGAPAYKTYRIYRKAL